MELTNNFCPPHKRNGIISAINLLTNSHYIKLKTTLLEECESCSNKKTTDGQTEENFYGRCGDNIFLRMRIIRRLTWSATHTAPQMQKQQNHLKVWFYRGLIMKTPHWRGYQWLKNASWTYQWQRNWRKLHSWQLDFDQGQLELQPDIRISEIFSN